MGLQTSQRRVTSSCMSLLKQIMQPHLLQWGREVEFSHREEGHMFGTIVQNLPQYPVNVNGTKLSIII